jgi:hypothetical protein
MYGEQENPLHAKNSLYIQQVIFEKCLREKFEEIEAYFVPSWNYIIKSCK